MASRTPSGARLVDPEDRGIQLDAAYEVYDRAVTAAWGGYRAANQQAWSDAMGQVESATNDYLTRVAEIRAAT